MGASCVCVPQAVERKKWESQQQGEQREIMERQRLKQEVAQAHLTVYNKETRQRLLNVQREREAHEAFLREYEAHVAEATREAVASHEAVIEEQAARLAARTKLKETKAFDLSGRTLPSIADTKRSTMNSMSTLGRSQLRSA